MRCSSAPWACAATPICSRHVCRLCELAHTLAKNLSGGTPMWCVHHPAHNRRGRQAMCDRTRRPAPDSHAPSRETRRSPTGEWVRSFTIVATSPNEPCAELHDRMPVILKPEGDQPGSAKRGKVSVMSNHEALKSTKMLRCRRSPRSSSSVPAGTLIMLPSTVGSGPPHTVQNVLRYPSRVFRIGAS